MAHLIHIGRWPGLPGKSPWPRNIPGRCLAVIFIAAITIGCSFVQAVHGFACPVLGFPGLAGIIIQVDHVLYRLVAMRVLAHVGYLHFADLVDHAAIITIIKYRRHGKYRIQFGLQIAVCRPSGLSGPGYHETHSSYNASCYPR
jgi:hypothetical protein